MSQRVEYKWLVAAVYVIGLFMDYLDATVTNVALPTFARQFHTDTTTVEWIATAYLLSVGVFIPISGWLGDRFGTKRTFLIALTFFTLGSALCATAWNVESLIAFRTLQGIGGGLLTPVGMTMLFRAFPPTERARVGAIIVLPTVIGPTSGPVLGGYLTEYQSWHWIFLINVPIGLLGLALAGRYLREHREGARSKLDLIGFVLGAGGLTACLYALAQVGPRGFTDERVVAFGLAGIALLAAFVLVELRTPHPLIEMRLFRDELFATGNVVGFFNQAVFVGMIFLLPYLLQAELGLSPFRSGLVGFPTAIGVAMVSPLAARLYDRVGPRRLMAAGMLLSALSALSFRWIGYGSGEWGMRALMLPRGWAFGLTLVPLQAATFATISPKMTGRASAAQGALRQIAASLGVAILVSVLSNRLVHAGATLGDPTHREQAIAAFHQTFVVAAVLSLFGVIAALFVKDRLIPHAERQPVPAARETVETIQSD